MNSSELNEAFRSGLGAELSRKFSDDDVWRLANMAYRQFVRLTGGIPDFTSPATVVAITAGQAVSPLDKLVLRIERMTLRSTKRTIEIVNHTDLGRKHVDDYRRMSPLTLDDRQGMVRYGVIGMERNKVRWVAVPEQDDTVDMVIWRLPTTVVDGDGIDLDEIDEQHHYHLLLHMNSMASAMPLVGNAGAAEAYGAAFNDYCAQVRREVERYRAKPVREVAYGGL